ncbi:MAG: hypothetical protein MUO21_08595 [Nitrososphaeraceae archaeon]|nr:hypothetical protein [Nitrososphaeraceae archaeon]
MNRIPATKYIHDTVILGFDANIYQNKEPSSAHTSHSVAPPLQGDSKEWIKIVHRYIAPDLEIIYDERKTMDLTQMRNKVIQTGDVDQTIEDISKNFLGSGNYASISNMLLACEIVAYYGYDPIEFFNLNLELGDQEDIECVLNQLKEDEMIFTRELADPETATVAISYRGEIFMGVGLHDNEMLILDRGNYTLDDLKLSKGLSLYEHVEQFLLKNDTLTISEKIYLKSHLTDYDSEDEENNDNKKFYNKIPEEDFNNTSYPRSIIHIPTKNLPLEQREYIYNKKFSEITTALDEMNRINSLEEFIDYQLNHGRGLWTVILNIIDELWPNNNVDEIIDMDVDKYNICGIICYILMNKGLCKSVDSFASWFS